jgi:hypothetical protein
MSRMAAFSASRLARINSFDFASAALIAALVILTFLTFAD